MSTTSQACSCLENLTFVIERIARVKDEYIDIRFVTGFYDLSDFWYMVHNIFDEPIGYKEAKRLQSLGVKEFEKLTKEELEGFEGTCIMPCTIRDVFDGGFQVDGLEKIGEKTYKILWGT